MAGTKEGGKKAAITREKNDPGSLSRAGRKGAKNMAHETRVQAGKKSAVTREQRHPGSLSEAGKKGGLARRKKKLMVRSHESRN